MDISYADLWRRRWRFIVKLPRMAGRALAILLLSALLMLLVLILVLAPFVAFENWRGHRAWARFTADCEAAGNSLRPEAVIPPPVPDEENFSAIPLFAPLFDYTLDRTTLHVRPKWQNAADVERLKSISVRFNSRIGFPQRSFDWQHGKPFDAPAWQAYFRHDTNIVWPAELRSPAEDILFALSKHDDDFKQLHAAVDRPQSRFPLKYEDGFEMSLPHLGVIRGLAEVASLCAKAHLSAGHSIYAFEDLLLALRLAESLGNEPHTLNIYTMERMLDAAASVLWEGLLRRAWADEELARLDRALAREDIFIIHQRSLRGQLSLIMLPHLEWEGQRQPYSLFTGFGALREEPPPYPAVKSFHVPQGIRRLYEMPVVRWMHRLHPLADSQARLFRVEEAKALNAEFSALVERGFFKLGYDLQAARNLLVEFSFVRLCARTQSTVDLARVAIALERHRLRHGAFPESLDVLDPEVRPAGGIPHDVIGGEPLRYRRTDDGRFQLYSVGWNQTDDGGTLGWDEGEERYDGTRQRWPNSLKGDWVWPQPVE